MDPKKAVDQAIGAARSVGRRAEGVGRAAGSAATGKASSVLKRTGGPKDLNDQDLKAKVESEAFRPAEVPKGKINVAVADGIVELRGEVKRPEDKEAIETEVRAIAEVRDVKNLLHLPKTPAPGRADSPGRQKRRS
jgi:osmotically-inducible protein OsmY